MYIKIYFDDKPVYLCDTLNKELTEILHHPDAIFIDELSAPAIKSLLHEITKPAFHAGVMLHSNIENLKKAFFKNFTAIAAAGGITQNDKKELLFIYRLDKWDLPKGKAEPGEDLQTCAVREVQEETGATGLTVQKKVGETYHTYNAFGKHFLKTTHWYYLTCPSQQKLVPQTEEDITAIKWVKIKNTAEVLRNTYPSIKDILVVFFATHKKSK
jgi:8-oxo-dGTP pyrophosphatase MutT (NUDIX family)